MSKSVYSIGIDLGTTNCALAYSRVDGKTPGTEVLPISQWETANSVVESETLPSFLYLPLAEEAVGLRERSEGGAWIVGRFARSRLTAHPARVIHSAKSWLGTSSIDQETDFLPWGSDQLSEAEKLSPVRASAQLLAYLQGAWNDRFDEAFDDQQITITVPASFDAAAQGLTLEAARRAGYPKGVRLLEEPQAAFYRWLETHEGGAGLIDALPGLVDGTQRVLVVDVGGGTSDFSLFDVCRGQDANLPEIRRIAVSDHILLGGDNIDLAMAHVVAEIQIDESLSPDQWSHLIARCRAIKEQVFAEPDRAEPFSLSIPSRGSGLIGGTLTAELSSEDVGVILFEGFYPQCGKEERPERSSAGLREFGLPYAREHAVTRHLAEFLGGRPAVDAVLFNGGSLEPESIRRRIAELIGSWQGRDPVVLENPEPSVAVARGAAGYGWYLRHHARRIEAGAPRTLLLEAGMGDSSSLVCILPKGTPREEEIVIDHLDLELRTNEPVSFSLVSSGRLEGVAPGETVAPVGEDYHRLPPLETVARAKDRDRIPVRLSSRLNATGLLHLECIDAGDPEVRWPLQFNLSGSVHPEREESPRDAGVSPKDLEQARKRILQLFGRDLSKRDRLTANRLVASLEKILGLPKQEWNAILLRKMWETHAEAFDWCYLSVDHEEAWLTFAGFLLRPGYGVQFDEERIDRLWRGEEMGYDFPGKRLDLARHVMWRRVAGGLNRGRQETLGEECLDLMLRGKKASAEVLRLCGALERVGRERKREFCRCLLEKGRELARDGGYAEPCWASLTLLLNRAPLYAGPETVLPPEDVAEAFEALRKLDWSGEGMTGIVGLFLRAARLVDNPGIDLPKKLRGDIMTKLKRSGVPPVRLTPLEKVVEVEATEWVGLYGESLPLGIRIAS